MNELKKQLQPMDDLEMPVRWDEIQSRIPRAEGDERMPGWRRLSVAAAALLIGAGAVAVSVTALTGQRAQPKSSPTVAPPLAGNGVIAIGSIAREGLFWTVPPDGSERSTVHVDVPGFIGVPSWSPDGSQIAFTLQSYDDPHPKGGNYDIWVANADGLNPVRLTHDGISREPEWSPDGTRIVYMREASRSEIWLMDADGSEPHALTAGADAFFPSWSADGSEITFVLMNGTNANIYLMNADGSNLRRLTDHPAREDSPAWSPDGRSIAFISEGGSRAPGIYTVSPDGTGVTHLLSDPDPANLGFAWSPDGASMAVVSRSRAGDRTLSVLDIQTGGAIPTAEPGAYFGPSWQPLPAKVEG